MKRTYVVQTTVSGVRQSAVAVLRGEARKLLEGSDAKRLPAFGRTLHLCVPDGRTVISITRAYS